VPKLPPEVTPAAQEITIDLNSLSLTNRDMLDFRREVGKSIQQAFKGADLQEWAEDPDWLAISALSWILGRKADKTLTLDDCLDANIDASGLIQFAQALSGGNPTLPLAADSAILTPSD